jgi:hypothetical protein
MASGSKSSQVSAPETLPFRARRRRARIAARPPTEVIRPSVYLRADDRPTAALNDDFLDPDVLTGTLAAGPSASRERLSRPVHQNH